MRFTAYVPIGRLISCQILFVQAHR